MALLIAIHIELDHGWGAVLVGRWPAPFDQVLNTIKPTNPPRSEGGLRRGVAVDDAIVR